MPCGDIRAYPPRGQPALEPTTEATGQQINKITGLASIPSITFWPDEDGSEETRPLLDMRCDAISPCCPRLQRAPGSPSPSPAEQAQPPRGTRGPVRAETAGTSGSPRDHAAQLLLELSGQGSRLGTGLSSPWSGTAQTHVRGAEARLAVRLPSGTGDFASRVPKVQLWTSPGQFPSSLPSPPAGISTLPPLFTPPKALGREGFAHRRVTLCFCCHMPLRKLIPRDVAGSACP